MIISSSLASSSSECFPGLPNQALPTKSGYLSVNKTTNSAIFYTYYKPHSPISHNPPILFWLQGGPGCSSMLGNFFELGPYRVTQCQDLQGQKHTVLEPNPGSWNRIFDLVFLDNPIGSGFSIASHPAEIPTDQDSVSKHLYTAITGFLRLEPGFRSRQVYILGESYAGKFVPSIGYYILKQNEKLPVSKRVNLEGIAIGNGLTDPVIQVGTHAANAYYVGLINEKQRKEMEEVQSKAVKFVGTGKWRQAANARSRVVRMLRNMTGLATDFDFTRKRPYRTDLVVRFLQSKDVKRRLGANESIKFVGCNRVIRAGFKEDVMKSVKEKVDYLLKRLKYKVLLYQGNLDLRNSVVSSEAWIKTMKWDGIERFLMAERKVWKVKGELAGYVEKYGKLSHVVVLWGGHMVPADQAVNSQSMVEDWVLEKGLFAEDFPSELKESV
ncbi:Serine carboxypeptidase-like 50 [Linum perenne]